jgi:hypothetical protein
MAKISLICACAHKKFFTALDIVVVCLFHPSIQQPTLVHHKSQMVSQCIYYILISIENGGSTITLKDYKFSH